MFLLVIIAAFLFGLYLTIFWLRRLRTFRSLNRFPGPKPYPILGNALEFGTNLTDVLKNMLRLYEKYGSIYRVYMGPYSVNLIITEPLHVQHFLSSAQHVNRSILHENFKPFLGNSLGCSKGDTWRQHRKLLEAVFHTDVLQNCMPIFNIASANLIEELLKFTGVDFNCSPIITEYSLNIICGSVMGKSSKIINKTYINELQSLMSIAIDRLFTIFGRNDFFFRYTTNYQKQTKHLKTLQNLADKIIAEKKREIKNTNQKGTLLDLILDLEEKGLFTPQDVKDEMNALLFAGHDAIATTTSFALYELSKHPIIQQKIYDEALQIFGPEFNNYSATIKDLDALKYLGKCMKEVLRLYTIVPFFERELAHKDVLDGTWIPKETVITFFPYAMHRNPEYYPDPDRFDPERWREELEMRRPKYAFIPFGGGPRNCIGFKFAILEFKLIIARIVLNFYIEPVRGFEIKLGMCGVLNSTTGMKIRLRKRVEA